MLIYNTLGRKKEEFIPVNRKDVIMYVCGLTPYDHMHLGHVRTYIAFDVIKRYLILKGFNVMHIQNVTDVEDKIIKRAKDINENPLSLAKRFQKEAEEYLSKLGVMRADVYPYVSEHIQDIINIISKLIERRYAYITDDGIYYRVKRFEKYGELSGQKIDEIRSGARVEINENKEDAIDFALWKFTSAPPTFNSPWGKGRPGWHIECSAMSLKYSKGRTIDIHGGAIDLIFPHHENEIAQSEGATGHKFVKYWMHTGYLTVNGEKMSKSLGNFITVKDALNRIHPSLIRYFFSTLHYRSPIDYNEKKILECKESLSKIRTTYSILSKELENGGYEEENNTCKDSKNETEKDKNNISNKLVAYKNAFFSSMDNDFDTPGASAIMLEFVGYIGAHLFELSYADKTFAFKLLKDMLYTFGLEMYVETISLEPMLNSIISIAKKLGIPVENRKAEDILKSIIEIRNRYRRMKKWEEADKIRSALKEIGIRLIDEKDKTTYALEKSDDTYKMREDYAL